MVTPDIEEIAKIRADLDLKHQSNGLPREILEQERHLEVGAKCHLLFDNHLMGVKQRAVCEADQSVGREHRRVGRAVDKGGQAIRWRLVHGDAEPAQVPSVAQIETCRALTATVGRDIAGEKEFVAFEDEVVIEHGNSSTRGERRQSRRA
jgi:hypothetical protein